MVRGRPRERAGAAYARTGECMCSAASPQAYSSPRAVASRFVVVLCPTASAVPHLHSSANSERVWRALWVGRVRSARPHRVVLHCPTGTCSLDYSVEFARAPPWAAPRRTPFAGRAQSSSSSWLSNFSNFSVHQLLSGSPLTKCPNSPQWHLIPDKFGHNDVCTK